MENTSGQENLDGISKYQADYEKLQFSQDDIEALQAIQDRLQAESGSGASTTPLSEEKRTNLLNPDDKQALGHSLDFAER